MRAIRFKSFMLLTIKAFILAIFIFQAESCEEHRIQCIYSLTCSTVSKSSYGIKEYISNLSSISYAWIKITKKRSLSLRDRIFDGLPIDTIDLLTIKLSNL